jgi:hypothetical protein
MQSTIKQTPLFHHDNNLRRAQMARLVCEMCGGTDLIKQDGVFVCQSCGCKYSVEEARKMMTGGPADIPDTKPDRSPEAVNILKNADLTFADGNYTEAFDLYSQVLNFYPEDAHSILYRGVASAWQSSVRDCRASEVGKASERAIKLKHEACGDTKEFFDFCTDGMEQIAKVLNAISNMYINYHNKAMPKTGLSITAAIATSGVANQVRTTMQNGTVLVCNIAVSVVTTIESLVKDYLEADDKFFSNQELIVKNAVVYRRNANMIADGSLDVIIRRIGDTANQTRRLRREKEEAEKRERIAQYWAAHTEEKQQMETRKNELSEFIQQAKSKIKSIPTDGIKSLEDEKTRLTNELNSLGAFKGREKKALQANIDAVSERLNTERNTYDTARRTIEKQIYEYESEVREIDREFTKDRL